MVATPVDDERLVREREYHNRRFEHEVREDQWKYYSAIAHGRALYLGEVERALAGREGLELGCGRGSTTLVLGQVARQVTAIDISDVAVENAATEAARLGIAQASFRRMNAEQLDFPDASVDVVFGKGIIHHLDLDPTFIEIKRVLRPGGTVIFYEPFGHNPVFNAYRNRTPDSRTPDEHPLLRSDIELARRHFGHVDVQFFGLLTLLGVPFRNRPGAAPLLSALRGLDRIALGLPGLRWLGWYGLILLRP
jgi:SAM-dependent methyltransferase